MKKHFAIIFLLSINTYTTPPLVRAAALINRRCIGSQRALSNTERIMNYLFRDVKDEGEKNERDYRQLYHFKCKKCFDSNKCPALQAAKVDSIDQFSVDRHISEIKDFRRRRWLYHAVPHALLLTPVMLMGSLFGGIVLDADIYGLVMSTVFSTTVCTSVFLVFRNLDRDAIENQALVSSCNNIYYKLHNKDPRLVLELDSSSKKSLLENNTKVIADGKDTKQALIL